MAKIAKDSGPSDVRQPEEPLHLRQPEVVPGSTPESAQEATRAAVVGSPDPDLPDTVDEEVADGDEPGPDPEPGSVVSTEPPEPPYDPKDHTVAEVNEHLRQLDEEDTDEAVAEYSRILDVERAGLNRKGIVGE